MDRTVLINAGPWLPVPPEGYGGIERLIADLIPGLRRRDVRVVLATVGDSTIDVDEKIWVHDRSQHNRMDRPYTTVCGIALAHMLRVAERLERGDIDLVHDHLAVVGPAMLSMLGERCPPVLHTLHWNLQTHPTFYPMFNGRGRVFFNGISESQVALAPASLRAQVLRTIPISVDPSDFPYGQVKDDYFLVLGRVTDVKGQEIAARICRQRGAGLILAGPISSFHTPEHLQAELANGHSSARRTPDVSYYLERVRPYLDGRRVRWIGSIGGVPRLELLRRARALLMPVRWDEPGGIVVIEALACGTPVVALRRGNLPTIVEHGVTGFLADDEQELAGYLERVGEIDPAACRKAVERRFSSEAMAGSYVDLYEQVIARTQASPICLAGADRRREADLSVLLP